MIARCRSMYAYGSWVFRCDADTHTPEQTWHCHMVAPNFIVQWTEGAHGVFTVDEWEAAQSEGVRRAVS